MNNEAWLDEIDKKIAEERRNYKGPYCCLTMDAELANEQTIICYNQKFREYGVKIPKSTRVTLMDYCMFCGMQLPSSCRSEWFEILEKEYGLERPCSGDKRKVPEEFLTDEWWKKRGL